MSSAAPTLAQLWHRYYLANGARELLQHQPSELRDRLAREHPDEAAAAVARRVGGGEEDGEDDDAMVDVMLAEADEYDLELRLGDADALAASVAKVGWVGRPDVSPADVETSFVKRAKRGMWAAARVPRPDAAMVYWLNAAKQREGGVQGALAALLQEVPGAVQLDMEDFLARQGGDAGGRALRAVRRVHVESNAALVGPAFQAHARFVVGWIPMDVGFVVASVTAGHVITPAIVSNMDETDGEGNDEVDENVIGPTTAVVMYGDAGKILSPFAMVCAVPVNIVELVLPPVSSSAAATPNPLPEEAEPCPFIRDFFPEAEAAAQGGNRGQRTRPLPRSSGDGARARRARAAANVRCGGRSALAKKEL